MGGDNELDLQLDMDDDLIDYVWSHQCLVPYSLQAS